MGINARSRKWASNIKLRASAFGKLRRRLSGNCGTRRASDSCRDSWRPRTRRFNGLIVGKRRLRRKPPLFLKILVGAGGFEECSKLAERFVTAHLAKTFGLYLPNALASDFQLLPDFFEG